MAGARTYRIQALVLDKTKLKETDLILALLAEDGRQIRAVAKGARKPGSGTAARCEVGCMTDLLLARGRNLDVVSQAELVEAPLGAMPAYEVLSAASVVLEVARLCSFEDAEDPFVFQITRRAIEVLGGLGGAATQGSLDLVVAAFVFKLLAHIGYRPDLSSCVACGDEAITYFSAQAGGLLCGSCAHTVAGAEEVDAATISWLRALMAYRFDELAGMEISPLTGTFLLSLAHSWAATHLDARLRAFEFLLGV